MNKLTLFYNNNSPSDKLIAETVFQAVDSSFQTPYFAKFHLIQNGENFLVLSKTERISDCVFRVENQKYSFKDANQAFSEAPKSMNEFIRDISQFPLLKLDTGKSSFPVGFDFPRYFEVENKMKVFLSNEILNGIDGNRGLDHIVSFDVIKRCIEKKQKFISKSQDNNFELDFFIKEKNRVLKLVATFVLSDNKRSHLNVLTAFYPTDSFLRYSLNNCSDFYYETWKKGLPQV